MSDSTENTPTKVSFVEITEADEGQRLDNFLFRHLKGVPKSRVYRALRHGEVRINKKRVKQHQRLALGDTVRIPPLHTLQKAPVFVGDKILQLVEQSIVYEDKDLLVVNKPSGLAVHGGSGLDYGLIEAVRKLRPKEQRLELVHRLDKATSGCTVISKKTSVLRYIHQQLREKKVQKTYLALVQGRWPKRKTVIKQPLLKQVVAGGERMVKVHVEGKRSETHFAIRQSYENATLIEAKPITGRTHQIRVHAQYAGFALLGDDKYQSANNAEFAKQISLPRLFLHAESISFYLPEQKKPICIRADLPQELEQVLSALEKV